MSNDVKEKGFRHNFLQRILTFMVGIPALVGLVFLAPEKGHWPFNALLLFLSIISAFEASQLFGMNPRETMLRSVGVSLNGIVFPTVSFLWVLGIVDGRFLLPIYTGIVMVVLFVQVFHQQHRVTEISPGISKHLAIITYPGLFMAHLIMISKIPNAALVYVVLLVGVAGNDTMAYLVGQLYKKYHDHPTTLSPNKTTAGFIAGFACTPLALFLMYRAVPEIFPGGLRAALILGLLIGFTTIIGDLIESGLKRSVKQKDSGEVILGRGGILDSIDSFLYTAPVFFYGYQVLNDIWVI